jgi:mRNA interferase MazF
MKQGEIWTLLDKGTAYAGKPRPALIIQSDAIETESITVALITSDESEIASAPLVRITVFDTESNGLRGVSQIMADKIVTVPRVRLGIKVGRLEPAIMRDVFTAIVTFFAQPRRQ